MAMSFSPKTEPIVGTLVSLCRFGMMICLVMVGPRISVIIVGLKQTDPTSGFPFSVSYHDGYLSGESHSLPI